MNLPTDPKSFEEAATRIRIGCSIVQQGIVEVCRDRPDREQQLRAAVGVIMRVVNEAQELDNPPVDPEMPILHKEEIRKENKEKGECAKESKQEQSSQDNQEAGSLVPTTSNGPGSLKNPTPKKPVQKRPAPRQWRESSEERDSDEEEVTSDYEEEVVRQKIRRARKAQNPKREREIVRRRRFKDKKAVVQCDPLVEHSQEWKKKFDEALEYHRTCSLYDDQVFSFIDLLQLFRPPISGKPNGELPQTVLHEIKTAKVLFLNWRKNTDTERATTQALREEEWKDMPNTERKIWYRREEAVYKESLVQLRRGFIRTKFSQSRSLRNDNS